MGAVDLLFVGHLGAIPMGAVGIGTSIFSGFLVLGIGLLSGMDYYVAKSIGEGSPSLARAYLKQGILIATLLSIPLTFAILEISKHLSRIGILPEVLPQAESYLWIIGWSIAPVLVFAAYRNYLQAVNKGPAVVITMVASNLLNAGLNWVFIFGHLGSKAYGTDGSAYATFLSRVLMLLALALIYEFSDRSDPKAKLPLFDWEKFRNLIRLGTPSSLQMVLEVGVFSLATALAARLVPTEQAAHQIVLNLASIAFMVPLGIGTASAVLVGKEIGAKQYHLAKHAGWNCVWLGWGYSFCSAAVLLLFPHFLLSIYTNDPSVIEAAKNVLIVAALFQFSDGTQTILTGALRGIADTRSAMAVNLVGHWGIGLPLGYTLCFHKGWGLFGLWIGLATGLTMVALFLLLIWTFTKKTEKLDFTPVLT